jgi:hypothetical protein
VTGQAEVDGQHVRWEVCLKADPGRFADLAGLES